MATKETMADAPKPAPVWRSDRFDSDSRMAAFLATLSVEDSYRAKIVGMPWGYTIFYPVSA